MHLKVRCYVHFVLAIALAAAGTMARAQAGGPSDGAQAVANATPATTGALHGHIEDQTGALIPGAQITVTAARGAQVAQTTADSAGAYSVRGLAPGSYVIQAIYSGFAPFVSTPISLAAGQTKSVDIKMAIETAQQQVVVSDEGSPQVSVEASQNSSSIVLKGDDLNALSDDPDELSNELTALAGPSAGPNGGQIYIDGFTGGQLPPKSAIREIRINQNPFSAEFDRLGYGRIEILTKPGTDTLHGRFFAQGNDDAFNTGNPFTTTIPSYHSVMLNGTVSGALSKKASFFFSVEQRNNQDASIYTVQTADQSGNLWYVPTVSGNTADIVPITGGLFTPATHTDISPRIDLQIGAKNTLTLRYQFFRNNASGQIGSTSLPSQNATSDTIEHTIQASDSQVISDRVVNETRFEYRRENTTETPTSNAPTISVPGFFSTGGNAAQLNSGHNDHYELQNITTMTAGAHAIKFGAWLRDNRQATSTDANYNGSFSFPTVYDYAGALNMLATGNACPTAPSSNDYTCGSVNAPNKLTYTTGPMAFAGNVFDGALYFQDDWKARPYLTLSGGLRWETQNHVADHDDWAPRVAFAYALDGHKKGATAKTVLRGGFGIFYDRFQVADYMNLEQYNGNPLKSQTQTVISNPTCFNPTSLSGVDLSSCGTPDSSASQIQTVVSSYHSPYTEQTGASLERQLTKTATLTFTYLHSFGVHQLVQRDSNAYLPGTYQYGSSTLTGVRPDPSLGIVDQFFPEAVFKQNQFIINIRAQFTKNLSLMGFYNITDAHSDGGGGSNPSNSYDLSEDYGKAGFVRPQMVFLMGNYNGPWGLTFNPFLIAQAGRPFNVTVENDLTGDNFFNNRPGLASASDCTASAGPQPTQYALTPFGCLDTDPAEGETLLPINLGSSPASVALNLRVSRSWGIGPKVESTGGPNQQGGGPPPGGGHGGGGRGGFGGFGGFGGPPGGGRGGPFGGTNTGRKYALTFSAQALNLFNNIDYGTPSGVVAPAWDQTTGITGPGGRFERSTSLAGGIFASPSGSAARRIFFQAAIQF
ncbi:MAG TPA: carboxypeptidase regulatory-like domain-containing protein [Terracidiphilus sp.]|nr:carboxypeptidase regulatory-like domain-containing protein [Terracidiphilus sp.]